MAKARTIGDLLKPIAAALKEATTPKPHQFDTVKTKIKGALDKAQASLDYAYKLLEGNTSTSKRRATKGRKTTKTKGGRKRLSNEDKIKLGADWYAALKVSGAKASAKDLGGLKTRDVVERYNKANPSKKIKTEGDKSTARYFVK